MAVMMLSQMEGGKLGPRALEGLNKNGPKTQRGTSSPYRLDPTRVWFGWL